MKFEPGMVNSAPAAIGGEGMVCLLRNQFVDHQVVVIKIVDHQVDIIIFSIVLVVIPYGPELHNMQIKTASSENKWPSQFLNI